MQIFVKLYGDLKRHAPGDQPNFTLNLDPGTTLKDIHRMLAIPKGQHVSLINGRRSNPDAPVADGDTLVLLPPISGG
ncbi:MAG: MoaD/ThiS family protein [Desulfobacterales bacterium]|jgi:molybdopterin converting factor small subunit|nr:MoaD/ThiS family protein [Desulfobacterales bacterium]MDP4979215.1 MoaD/ThiS family protein [Desulfobacterales bacterium]